MLRFIFLALVSCAAHAQDVRHLTILHSNDLHARLTPDNNQRGGFAYLATAVRKERANCRDCLYLNAGDLVQGTPVSTLFQGTPVYEIANLLDFDASTLGNHEFDYGWRQIARFMQIARFPTVTSNVTDGAGKLIAPQAFLIKKVNGIRVGIIGAVMSNLLEGFLMPKTAGPCKVQPAVATIARYAQELRERTDVIVVLAHFSPAEGSEVIRTVPQVSVVVEGHAHAGRKELEAVEGRVAVGCEGYGVNLCRLDLEVNVPQKKLVSWSWKKIPIDAKTIVPAKDVEKKVAYWEKRVSEKVDVPIGEAKRLIQRDDLRLLIERAMRDEMQAEFSSMNRGGVRDVLPQGTLLARHVWNVMPFDNLMVVAKVKGSRVPEALRGTRELEPDREYRVVMADFSATNPSTVKELGIQGIQFETTELFLRDLIINWIRKQKVVE